MRPIEPGVTGTFALTVSHEHLANQFKDSSLPPVLATPMLILAMENAAYNAVKAYLEPGETAVGTVVNIQHLAATPLGSRVTASAQVVRVDGRRIVFRVNARDGADLIGVGSHERAIVSLARFDRSLAARPLPDGVTASSRTPQQA